MKNIGNVLFVCALLAVAPFAIAQKSPQGADASVIDVENLQGETAESVVDNAVAVPLPENASDPAAMTAADDAEASSDGVMPGDTWYPLQRWGERLSVWFTFDEQEKAEKMMALSERRLTEVRFLADAKKYDLLKETLRSYRGQITDAASQAIALQDDDNAADDLLRKVGLMTLAHQNDFLTLYDNAPEEVQSAVENTIKTDIEEYASALTHMSPERREAMMTSAASAEEAASRGIKRLRAAGVDMPEMATIKERVRERAKDEVAAIAKEKTDNAATGVIDRLQTRGKLLLEKVKAGITVE